MELRQIIITDTIGDIGTSDFEKYLGHALCIGGSCRIQFNGSEYTMHSGDLMIVRQGRLVANVTPDDDFRVVMVYISSQLIELSMPQNNYGMKGQVSLFLNPIMHLNAVQFDQCRRNFDNLKNRIEQTAHHFYRDMIINKVQSLILDFFDFHASLYHESNITTQYAATMNRFLTLLENGEYRQHREVTWYADRLCITSKYLSEVSKAVSGYSANFWINRYTTLDISRQLRDKTLSFVDISDMFNFSSPAYFSRYVQHNLGLSPSEYRN